MPVVVYRQPWFWAVIAALVAIFVFGIVIFASSPEREEGATTIVQQPAPAPAPEVTPTPIPQPMEPVTPAPVPNAGTSAAPPAEPQPPQVIRERTVIIREGAGQKAGEQRQGRQPQEGATAPPQESRAPEVFRNTGLPRELEFDDRTWKAQEVTTVPQGATALQSLGPADDGTELFARAEATEPYVEVFALVPGETDRYVRYSR